MCCSWAGLDDLPPHPESEGEVGTNEDDVDVFEQ